MSLFSQAFEDLFVPALFHWHSDPITLTNKAGVALNNVNAMVRDEYKQRRRIDEYHVDEVTIRHVQVVTKSTVDNYCGREEIEENSTVTIGGSVYSVERVSQGDHGMSKLQMILTERVHTGNSGSLGE